MSKDYKAIPTKSAAAKPAPGAGKPKPAGKGSPLMVGLLIGLLVGLALSLGVAFFVKSGGSAFQEKAVPAADLPADKKAEPTETAPPTPAAAVAAPDAGQISSESLDPNKKPAEADKKEDRFTFYGILTEKTPPAPIPDIKEPNLPDAANPPAAPGNPITPATSGAAKPIGERYYLQVGAFQTEKEADNTKAKLSLIGMDAIVQTATIPDKGILHRVRVGPISGSEELNRMKAELARNGFNAEAVKISN